MKVVLGSRQKVIVKVLAGRRTSWHLFLHDWHKVLLDFINLILGKQVGDLAGAQDVVDELQEAFILDLIVGEDERDAFAIGTSHSIQQLEIFHQVVDVVRSKHDTRNIIKYNNNNNNNNFDF